MGMHDLLDSNHSDLPSIYRLVKFSYYLSKCLYYTVRNSYQFDNDNRHRIKNKKAFY